jgi:nitrogen fixation NifU-like protein
MEGDADRILSQIQQQLLAQARRQYSETVVDHWVHPRHPGRIERPDGHARIKGPCGDTMEICIRVDNGAIADASFVTDGCITSIASASMAVELATGKVVPRAVAISQRDILDALGGLPAESRHCALLAANTLRAAIGDYLRTRSAPWKRIYR